jgi:4-aminobutyrate aminotransferase-like enzyme
VSERENVIGECFNNGLILLPSGVSTIRIIPPITISMENLEKGMNILEAAIKNSDKKK